MIYFGIYDEISVTKLSLKGKNSVLIRIFEPNSNNITHPLIINHSDYKDILEVFLFDYVTSPKSHELDTVFKKINNFVLTNNFDEIIIHCSLGLSRSPAIMICIAKILNNHSLEQTVKEKYKHYNKFIVKEFENYPYIQKSGLNNEKFEYINKENVSSEDFVFDCLVIEDNRTSPKYLTLKKNKIKDYQE